MFVMLPAVYLWDLYGISIAFAFRSFDRSLFARSIAPYKMYFSNGL